MTEEAQDRWSDDEPHLKSSWSLQGTRIHGGHMPLPPITAPELEEESRCVPSACEPAGAQHCPDPLKSREICG